MKTCADCQHWGCSDGCCWCDFGPKFLYELDWNTPACEEFEPKEIEQEEENETAV